MQVKKNSSFTIDKGIMFIFLEKHEFLLWVMVINCFGTVF